MLQIDSLRAERLMRNLAVTSPPTAVIVRISAATFIHAKAARLEITITLYTLSGRVLCE